jgi:hypothetical protein
VNKRRALVVGIAVTAALVIGLLAMPVKIRCGHPGYACATAPDEQGYVHFYYVVAPFGVALVEELAGVNISFHYRSGVDREKT